MEACAAIGAPSRAAAVLQVGRDPRAAEGVVVYFSGDAGRLGATAHHSSSIVSVRQAPSAPEECDICRIAKALGLTVPPALLAHAGEVIK